MDKVIYLRPKEEDIPQIKDILDGVRGNNRDLKADDFWVAAAGEKIVGCGRFRKLSGGCLELSSIAVLEEYRGHGIGSEIIGRLLREAGDKPIYLECFEERKEFYGKFGFEIAEDRYLPADFKEEFVFLKSWLAGQGKKAIAMEKAGKKAI
jgi:N-acetylglutamate synthase-like GNAT family acetyltransferase